MKIVLSAKDRLQAYREYVHKRTIYADDEELVAKLPAYADAEATVEIVKKPPQEQPQE